MSLQTATRLAVKTCKKLGADEVEAYAQLTRTVEVVLERAEIQSERVKTQQGIGIRAVRKKALGFAYTSDLSKASIENTSHNAFKLAKTAIPNPEWVCLPEARKLPKSPTGTFDKNVAALSGNDVLALSMKAYDAAKRTDKRVDIDDGKFSAVVSEVAVDNSHGIDASEKGTLLSGFLICVAKEKGEVSSMAFEYDVSRSMKFSPENIGRYAAEKAAASLKPKTTESFTGQLVLDPDTASDILLYPLVFSVNADNTQRKRSAWANRVNEKVATQTLTVIDNGLLPNGIGSSTFDAEGVPRQKTPIITKGVLKGFLHNSYTANKEKRKSTGNATRENYNALPAIFASNLMVEPGKKKLDDIISLVDKGIIVRRFSGNVRPESGEFSGIAKQASYIEKGEIKHPLKETMISGNSFNALMNIVAIGSEIRPSFMSAYVPPMLVDKVNIVSK
jgi:PmbA protein